MKAESIVTILMIFFVCGMGFLIYEVSPAGIAGVQITHNGTPIHNLEVKVYFTSDTRPDIPNKIATTDGTGTVTVQVSHGHMWDNSPILYDFNYNDTTYSFSGPLTQIVEVSV